MKFAKIISCGDRKIEITANTYALIDTAHENQLNEFDVDEFMEIYENISGISEIKHEINMLVTDLPFQVDFWKSFCAILTKSAAFGFLSLGSSRCLTEACGSLVPNSFHCMRSPEEDEIEECSDLIFTRIDGEVSFDGTYSYCSQIELTENNQIIVRPGYSEEIKVRRSYGEVSSRNIGRSQDVSLKYPCDYLELLENVESYLVRETAPRKSVFLKESKSRELSQANQMIMDFLQANKKEIEQFKRYVSEFNKKESLKEQERCLYCDFFNQKFLNVNGKAFPEKYCGFDIYEKKREIDAIVQKLQNSSDAGEDEVEYAISWLCAETPVPFKAVKKNCESKYRYGCILLKNSSFIDATQEYDHILVSNIGVILVETKHWKGRVEIRPDGKWVRDPDNDGCTEGIESPLYQIQRHEALMKSILPNVPIHSLLVFSNPSLILDGVENCNMCHVVYVDKLKETVMNIFLTSKPIDETVDYCLNEIEKHKVNIMKDNIVKTE